MSQHLLSSALRDVYGAHGDVSDRTCLMSDSAWNPDSALRRDDPGAFACLDDHYPARRVNQLGTFVVVPRGSVAMRYVAREHGDRSRYILIVAWVGAFFHLARSR